MRRVSVRVAAIVLGMLLCAGPGPALAGGVREQMREDRLAGRMRAVKPMMPSIGVEGVGIAGVTGADVDLFWTAESAAFTLPDEDWGQHDFYWVNSTESTYTAFVVREDVWTTGGTWSDYFGTYSRVVAPGGRVWYSGPDLMEYFGGYDEGTVLSGETTEAAPVRLTVSDVEALTDIDDTGAPFRYYTGTVTNDNPFPVADVTVICGEERGGEFFDLAVDEYLYLSLDWIEANGGQAQFYSYGLRQFGESVDPATITTSTPFDAEALETDTIGLSASAGTTSYRGTVRLTGALNSWNSTPIVGEEAQLWYQPYGQPWQWVRNLEPAAGTNSYSTDVKPDRTTQYQFVFPGNDRWSYAESATRKVIPRAYLSRPSTPSRVRRGRTFTTYGYLKPRHTAGGYSVRLYFQRYERRRWRSKFSSMAKNYNYSSYTKYSKRRSLPYRGRWRVRAYHYDSNHGKTYSSYRYITVK